VHTLDPLPPKQSPSGRGAPPRDRPLDRRRHALVQRRPEIRQAHLRLGQEQRARDLRADADATASANDPDSNWNFEISNWDDKVIHEQADNKPYLEFNYEPKNLRNLLLGSESGWHDEEAPKTLFIDPSDIEFFDDVDDFSDSEDESASASYKKSGKGVPNAAEMKVNDKSVSSHNSSENSDDADREADMRFQFTIDINRLKADMKKKSAKLLSKLSVNSNDCSLVRDLVKASEPTGKGVVETSLTVDLESVLNVNSSYKNELLGNQSGQGMKKSYFIDPQEAQEESEAQMIDARVGELAALNRWFDDVQLNLDLNRMSSMEKENVVANIRRKLSLPTKKAGKLLFIKIMAFIRKSIRIKRTYSIINKRLYN